MDNKEFNLLLNNILGEVKPLYLRNNIFGRLYSAFEQKNKEIQELKVALSSYESKLPIYINHIKKDCYKSVCSFIRSNSVFQDCSSWDNDESYYEVSETTLKKIEEGILINSIMENL